MSSLLGFMAPAPGLLESVYVCLSSPGSLEGSDDWSHSGVIPTLQILHFSSPAGPCGCLLSSAVGWWHCAPVGMGSSQTLDPTFAGGRGSLCLGAGPSSRKDVPWGRTHAGLSGTEGLCHGVPGLGPHHPPPAWYSAFSFLPFKKVDLVVLQTFVKCPHFFSVKTELPPPIPQQYFSKHESESFLFF